jgi:methylated-DNA-protein-cysteine methyltransferase related protein
MSPRADLGPFARAVSRIVRGIPRGRVLSYGEVALRAGRPGGARAVVRALHQLEDVPWWRVVRKGGTLAPEVAWEQAQLLAAEGVKARAGRRARRRAR